MRNKTAEKYGKQIVSTKRELRPVKMGLMKVAPAAQREFRADWTNQLVAEMDIDKLGNPEVSQRDGFYWIMDGQHRVEAVKIWNGEGWEEQHLMCWVWEGLTEKDEADNFLSMNNRKTVNVFQKFKVACRAGRTKETEILQIVKKEGLNISNQRLPGAVGCVGTLLKSYDRDGAFAFARALRLARDAHGDPGMDSCIIDGYGLLCNRYNGILDEKSTIHSLSAIHGGVKGLLGAAEQLRLKMLVTKPNAVAMAAVQIINRGIKGNKKLPAW